MGNIFKRKKIEKESNIAISPKQEETPQKITKKKVFFLLWNILSIALYSSYTFFVTYRLSQQNFLGKVILILLLIYAVSFILLLLLSIRSKNKLKYRLKNYKSATIFLKSAVQIINFILSIVTAVSALITTGSTDVSAVTYAVLSFIITIFMILVEIAKIIIRKNIPLIKRNFLEMRDDGYSASDENETK